MAHKNEILDELRKIRDDHAKQCNYDMDAIYEEWKEYERQCDMKLIAPPKKKKIPRAA